MCLRKHHLSVGRCATIAPYAAIPFLLLRYHAVEQEDIEEEEGVWTARSQGVRSKPACRLPVAQNRAVVDLWLDRRRSKAGFYLQGAGLQHVNMRKQDNAKL